MIKAKPIVKNKFWILRDGKQKVGEVNATSDGFHVSTKYGEAKFKTLTTLKRKSGIEFDDSVKLTKKKEKVTSVHGYPASGKIYNAVWDVHNGLPIYTKEDKSKSHFAAGWYQVKLKNKWKTVYCPKIIILERNTWKGPYKTDPDKTTFEAMFTNDTHK